MIVVVCPGQGSQSPGFLTPWLEDPALERRLREMSEVTGLDLVTHGTVSDADTIRDTAVAQPLIVAAGLLTLGVLLTSGRRERIGGIAGHSVGEITAAVGAGILETGDALTFVRERGQAMAQAAASSSTGMSAVLGGDEEELLDALGRLELAPANMNGGGQVVVAGPLDRLEKLRAEPPAGARVIPLQVAGAFHTDYMSPAVAHLQDVARGLTTRDPLVPIWSNSDGTRVTDGRRFVDLLVGQVSSPVRWDRTMASFVDAGVTGIIEVAPAGALVGLTKRGIKGVPTVAIKTPGDLDAAIAMIEDDV